MKIKSKETKEENRIPIENLMGYDDIISEFALYILTYLIGSWIYRGCSEESNDQRNHSICYTTTTSEVHTFKNKNKRK